jgi:uncharacterized membrane protein
VAGNPAAEAYPQGAGPAATLRYALRRGEGTVSPARAWVPWAAFALSLFGLGVSTYLTIAHFSSTAILACSDQGIVNCAKVTTSPQSEVFGVLPVAVLGLAFYVVLTVINVPAAWRVQDRRVHLARLALVVIGMAFVLYLLAAELLIIGNICLWCTSVHLTTFLLFILTISTVPAMLGWGREA